MITGLALTAVPLCPKAGVAVDLAYPGREPLIGGLAGRTVRGGAAPVIETRAGDAQDVAEPLDAEPALVIVNELAAVQEPSINYCLF
ncbi:hypothetical protein ACFTXM_38830 [Streptomyces sp. NPDC056930]|uniref:hypothetical protein n=1 Tax=Streptomyces sp. NPDC056930 TaxID=3345967 RepID=UPI00362A95F1